MSQLIAMFCDIDDLALVGFQGRGFVDGVQPHSLNFDNLQILCEDDHHGKGTWDSTDWR